MHAKYFEFITMLFYSETFEVDHEHMPDTDVCTAVIKYIETIVRPDFFENTNTPRNTLLLRQEIIREVVKNILDAHATQFTIQCTNHTKGMCIKFIDNGDGIHAAQTDQKHGNNDYYGGAGKCESLLKTALPRRPVYPRGFSLKKFFGLPPDREFLGYRRHSDEYGSRTTVRLP